VRAMPRRRISVTSCRQVLTAFRDGFGMLSVQGYICVFGVALAIGTTAVAGASEVACAKDKLKDEHFQEALSRDHDGVIVRLDVDADAYLKAASDNSDVSEARRQELLQQGSVRLLAAKIELLEGSRFSVYQNLKFGSEVVVLVDGMSDVCELSANPHVKEIWVNSRWKLQPLRRLSPPESAASAANY